MEKIIHTIDPVYDEYSKILILGTMPSPKSREANFYYGHPQNRFWPVMAKVFNTEIPETNEDKIKFLLKNNIALWDVLASCDIDGADDSSIRNPVPNDINLIIKKSGIRRIFTTGRKAFLLYEKLCFPKTNIKAVMLPSTSPANCRCSFNELVEKYYVCKAASLDRQPYGSG